MQRHIAHSQALAVEIWGLLAERLRHLRPDIHLIQLGSEVLVIDGDERIYRVRVSRRRERMDWLREGELAAQAGYDWDQVKQLASTLRADRARQYLSGYRYEAGGLAQGRRAIAGAGEWTSAAGNGAAEDW